MNYPEPIYIPQTISTNVSLAEICSKGYTENLTSVYSIRLFRPTAEDNEETSGNLKTARICCSAL